MKKIIRNLGIIFIIFFLSSCSITQKLERHNYLANIKYIPRKIYVQKHIDTSTKIIEIKKDSGSVFIVPALDDGKNKSIINVELENVTVRARSQMLAERKGRITLNFIVNIPKELQGNCQSVMVRPILCRKDSSKFLQDLVISGKLFNSVQKRNYWQYAYYKSHNLVLDSLNVFKMFIKYPYPKDVRLDSIVDKGSDILYYYTEDILADELSKKLMLILKGSVVGLDDSKYYMDKSDTLVYNISSMISLLDTATRYKIKVIKKYAIVNDRNYLSYKLNSYKINERLNNNKNQLEHINIMMQKFLKQEEFYVDSIILIARSSPDGRYLHNLSLSKSRAKSLKNYLAKIYGSKIDTLLSIKWIAEDWNELKKLLINDKNFSNNRKYSLLKLWEVENKDKREREFKRLFPGDYKYTRDSIFPKLRAVDFRYSLRRVGMIKDTIHTTEIDSNYLRGVRFLKNRKYLKAMNILAPYKDLNYAIVLMSKGYDKGALNILIGLKETAINNYLKAILYYRLGDKIKAKKYYTESCKQDKRMVFRGNLDPEISELLKDN